MVTTSGYAERGADLMSAPRSAYDGVPWDHWPSYAASVFLPVAVS